LLVPDDISQLIQRFFITVEALVWRKVHGKYQYTTYSNTYVSIADGSGGTSMWNFRECPYGHSLGSIEVPPSIPIPCQDARFTY
jgi:hypothetical protein